MAEETRLVKLPPQSIEAEQSVLGSMILDRDQIAIVIEVIKDSDFYSAKHAEIYRAITELYEKNDPVDMVTLIEQLERSEKLEKIGGAAYLSTLIEGVPTPKSAPTYAKIVEQKSTLRDLIKAGNEIVQSGYDADGEVDEIVSQSEKLLYDISKGSAFKDITPMKPVLKEAFDQINTRYQRRGSVSGLPTPYEEFNRLTGGFQNSDLIVLAARPGMGKTSLALNFAEYLAVNHSIGVGLFSLEMAATQLVTRMICSLSQVDALALREGFLVDEDWPRLSAVLDQLNEAPVVIVDSPGLSPIEVRAKARRMQKEFGVEMIIIDYLQLMSFEGRYSDSRVQQISEITRQMKMLARELDIPVICVSQLSRAVEKRENKRPQLSDLRESGSIEQDADLVLFLYRPDYYKEQQGDAGEDDEGYNEGPKEADEGKTELIIAKHRNGPTGRVDLTFLKRYTRFESYTDRKPYS
ncbi:MAG TPA: replicative DNA helicase [bacterium]|nr:replicative DNA helicase [bacterium]